MKKIYTFFFTALLFFALSLPAMAAVNVSVEDARRRDDFDDYLNVYMMSNGAVNPGYMSTTFGWGKNPTDDRFVPVSSSSGAWEMADCGKLTPEIIMKILPEGYEGAVAAVVRHAFTLPEYPRFDYNFDGSILIDGIYRFFNNDISGASIPYNTDYFRMILSDTTDSYNPRPDTVYRYTDSSDLSYLIVLDKDGGYIGTARLGKWNIGTDDYRPDYYTYSLNYSFTEETIIKREQFPISVYALSLDMNRHALTASVAEGCEDMGTISPNGETSAASGSDTTYTITANPGYMISEIIVDAGTDNETHVTPSSRYLAEYTLTADAPHTITAVFAEDSSAPVVTADEGITATVTDVADGPETGFVSEFEAMGFTDGSRNVNVAANDMGGVFTADADGFVRAAKLSVSYESGAGGGSMTISVPPARGESFDPERQYYMLVLNNHTNTYDLYEAAVTSGGRSVRGAAAARAAADGEAYLTATVSPASDYEPNTQLFVYSGVAETTGEDPSTPPTGGESKSGGGCNAGFGALALLAFAPLALRRRKQ